MVVGRIQAGDHGLFDLGAAEALGCLDHLRQLLLEILGIPSVLLKVNADDGCPLIFGREPDEENFIKASLPQQLRGKSLDAVDGGHNEAGRRLLLHPGDERAKHALRRAPIGAAIAADSGERFLELVEPQDAGADCLGRLYDCAHVALGLADEASEDAAEVQFQEGNLPNIAAGLRGK